MRWRALALLVALGLGLNLGCRPAPYAVTTVVSWRPTKAEGRRCYHRCQSHWHGCAASCGGGSTTVMVGVGPVAFGQTRSSAGCRHHCRDARIDCLRGCDGLEERVTQVRFCPHGPGHCEEPDPRSPTLQLPVYCEDRDGRLHPCGPE